MDPRDNAPLSVSRHFFEKVCPKPVVICVEDVNTKHMRFSKSVPVTETFNVWVETLKAVDDPCMSLNPSSNQVFNNCYVNIVLDCFYYCIFLCKYESILTKRPLH